jgi:hypothetical protein
MTDTPHPIPPTLDAWLAGWKPAATGNHYQQLGQDMYAVYRDRGRGGWTASVGRHHTRLHWDDPDNAKAGLYHVVAGVSPAVLDAWHRGVTPPEPGPPAPPDAPPSVLCRVDRADGSALVLERREFKGSAFLAVVNAGDRPRFATIRLGEARRVALALLRAAPDVDAPAEPRGVRHHAPWPPGWPSASPPPWDVDEKPPPDADPEPEGDPR